MKKPNTAQSATAVVIVFGRTAESKVARGAKFRIEDREKALAAAMDRNFDLIMDSDEETRRIAKELPEGRFAVNGRAQLPTIAPALYERLRALAASVSEEGGTLGVEGLETPTGAPAATSAADEFDSVLDPASEPREDRAGSASPDSSTAPERTDVAAPADSSHRPEERAQAEDVGPKTNSAVNKIAAVPESTLAAQQPSESTEPSVPIAGHMAIEGLRAIERQGEASHGQPPNPATAAATAPAMPQDGPAESAGVIAPAVIVFGRSGIARPRAGWFPMIEAGLARKAAERQTLSSLPIATPDEYRLASQISRGKLFGHGLLTVPATVLALFEKLLQLYERARSERRTELTPDPEPTAPRLPTTWADIGVGSLVLAPEEDDEGWWEAEVLALAGDELALRWRHVPEEAVFVRKLAQIALLSPERPLAV